MSKFSTMKRLNETVISNSKHRLYTSIMSEIQYNLYWLLYLLLHRPSTASRRFSLRPAERCWLLYNFLCFPFPPLPLLLVTFLFFPAEPVPPPPPTALLFSLSPSSTSLLLNPSFLSLAPLLVPWAPQVLACWLPELFVWSGVVSRWLILVL